MSAQTGMARKSDKPDADPSAPVIVKMGGGGGGVEYGKDTSTNQVTIESRDIPFSGLFAGQTWELSKSNSEGRIFGLEINGEQHSITPSRELASVRVEFGGPQLLLMESGVGDALVMFIASVGGRFHSPEQWMSATADGFPSITGVVLMQGTTVKAQRHFSPPSADVTLKIDFQSIF